MKLRRVNMKEKAYGKVNLHLDVLGKRLDHYHNLEMVMAPLHLHDIVTFKVLEDDKIIIESNKKITAKPEDNLVYKIAKYLKERFNIQKGIKIYIEKHIPIAAGLAGGSADAAATLRGMNKLFNLNLTLIKLAEIGEMFGADIPFCVHNKLCIARGKGEALYFLKVKLNLPILLITPKIKVSTKEVFSKVKMDAIRNVKITTMTNAIYNKNTHLVAQRLYNALEPFAFTLYPEIKTLKDSLIKQGYEGVLMSGSGPTVFVIDQKLKILKALAEQYQDDFTVNLSKIQ